MVPCHYFFVFVFLCRYCRQPTILVGVTRLAEAGSSDTTAVPQTRIYRFCFVLFFPGGAAVVNRTARFLGDGRPVRLFSKVIGWKAICVLFLLVRALSRK